MRYAFSRKPELKNSYLGSFQSKKVKKLNEKSKAKIQGSKIPREYMLNDAELKYE